MSPRTHNIPLPNATGVGTHTIHVRDWGNVDAARTAVCVHGLTRNAQDFSLLAEALAANGYRVLAPSMAGRGDSAWLTDPMGYTYPAYVTDCLAVMDNFHLRQVDWVGTSMGGIIGMMLEAQTGRIRKLVLNDIGIHLSAAALKRIYDYVLAMPAAFENREAAETYLRENFASWGIDDPMHWAMLVEHSLEQHDGKWRYACDPRILEPLHAISENFTKVSDSDLSPLWEEIKIPTFILHGAASDILTPLTINAMRATNPRLRAVTFEGVGHAPALMATNQIDPIVDWLLGKNTGMLALGI
ncbi:MAG: alpha/beta fold hydrolase [Rickettsiales bacterium]